MYSLFYSFDHSAYLRTLENFRIFIFQHKTIFIEDTCCLCSSIQHTYVSSGNGLPFIFWALLCPGVCFLMMNFNQGALSFPEKDG